VAVDFAIVPLLERKHEIDSSSLKALVVQTKVPSANLEQMKNIFGDLFDAFIHQILHGFHLPLAVPVFVHITLFLENLDIEKSFFGRVLFETFRNLIKTVANTDYNQVLLFHLDVRVHAHHVVVLQDAADGGFELCLVFVVHCDADGQFRGCILKHT
jgi:hypothetical protein